MKLFAPVCFVSVWFAMGTAKAGAQTRDSAGVLIIESAATRAPDWIIATRPAMRIGTAEGQAAFEFDRIRAAFQLRSGGLVVVDGGTHELRFFSADGRHLRTVGRTGGGPGEFMAMTAVLKLPGDSLLVHDIRNRRITVIGADGTVVRDEPAPAIAGGGVTGRLSSGQLAFLVRPGLRVISGYSRDTAHVAIRRSRDGGLDTLIALPSTEQLGQRITQPRAGSVTRIHPFGYQAQAAVWYDRIVTGTSESYEFHLIDEAGRLRAVLRRTDAPRVPLDGEPLRSYLDDVTRAGWSAAASLEIMRNFPGTRYVPAYSMILVDDPGCLWVRDFAVHDPAGRPKANGWTIFDRSGQVVARATSPPGFDVFHVTTRAVVSRVRDEYDVEYIEVHALERIRSDC